MNSTRPWWRVFLAAFLGVFVFSLSADLAHAQSTDSNAPKNGHANAYRAWWSCDVGYKKTDEACVAIEVPANAILAGAGYGKGWECRRGFQEANLQCEKIDVPSNAYLSASGNRWVCERGHKLKDKVCAAIKVPENGYLNDRGDGWNCGPGFAPHTKPATR